MVSDMETVLFHSAALQSLSITTMFRVPDTTRRVIDKEGHHD